MLARNTYPQAYIDESRARVDAQVDAYRALAAAGGTVLDAAFADFEPCFFNNLLLAMDSYFTHRTRAIELKDGNPLNEVRLLSSSLTEQGGVLTLDKTIKYQAENAVLGLAPGDTIAITEADFVAISAAFFADLQAKFAE